MFHSPHLFFQSRVIISLERSDNIVNKLLF
nr:MAG TPA: hypothetical protein [Caudoviricetes sp.]